jgi:hypothetical protein
MRVDDRDRVGTHLASPDRVIGGFRHLLIRFETHVLIIARAMRVERAEAVNMVLLALGWGMKGPNLGSRED